MEKLTWQDAPGYFDFADIYDEAVAQAHHVDFSHFVEVGVMFGRSALYLAQAIRASGKNIIFDAVDRFNWKIDESLLDKFDEPLRTNVRGMSQLEIANHIRSRAGLERHVHFIQSSGQDAARLYADASLDFVFIDAEHGYQDTVELLRAYLPKMKPGSLLAGHDFDLPGVRRAVLDVLGDKVRTPGKSFVYEVTC
jgi:predicted O-methyltransferase YrrM